MIEVRQPTTSYLVVGFALGAALTAALLTFGTAWAQTPIPVPTLNVQAMIDACRAMMSTVVSSTQGLMAGMCPMMGR
jgi:uncharacterized membrane protein